MNKGYAFGFLLVLLVVALGFYVAYTGFVSTRETARAIPTSPGPSAQASATHRPVEPSPTVTLSATLTSTMPTPIPGLTATLEAIALAGTGEPAAATQPPDEAPAAATAVPTEPPTAAPSPTPAVQAPAPTAVSAFPFRLAGPVTADPGYPNCCYVYGTVRDKAGNGLEGVQIQALNEWTPPVVAVSKGGVDLGKYDIPINTTVRDWDLVLVDATGKQISGKVRVTFDPQVANGYRVDWQRTY